MLLKIETVNTYFVILLFFIRRIITLLLLKLDFSVVIYYITHITCLTQTGFNSIY